MLNKPELTAAVKEAALKALGRPIKVVVTDTQKVSDSGVDKLDAISKFGNITFK